MIAVINPLRPIEDLLTSLLEWFHATVGLTWAWSIVALVVLVRLVLVPVTVRQIHSMQNLQAHAPEMKEIQQKWKHDRARQNEELMKFYRENKINPAASCLPIVLQIPIFISLFYVLRDFEDEIFPQYPDSSLEFLGLVNITEPTIDGWGPLLLVVYVISQLTSSYFMSTSMQKAQRILLLVLPIVFIPFILNFPSGLMIYWLTTNLWTTGQGLVTRKLMPKPNLTAQQERRSSRTPPKDEPVAPATEAERQGEAERRQRQAGRRRPPRRRRTTAAREAKAKRRRPAPMTDELSVEASGETVGEAKWSALRELERLAPGLDRDAVRFQVVTEGERGLLGVGYTPARVVATAERPPEREPDEDESGEAAVARELLGRVLATIGVDGTIGVDEARGRGARDRDRRRPRRPHRPARPDDRRAAVPRERHRAPAARRGAPPDRRRRRGLPRAACLDARLAGAAERRAGFRDRPPRRARADERGRATPRARGAQGRSRGLDDERGCRAEPLRRRDPAPRRPTDCPVSDFSRTRVAPAPARGLDRWLAAVVATPGLTALRDPAEARRVLLDDALRGVSARRRGDRPDRRRRLGRRHAGDPARRVPARA